MNLRIILFSSLIVSLVACATQTQAPCYFQKLRNGECQAALEEITVYARQGDSKAQHTLGVMYAKGDCVAQDYEKAITWYKQSAAQGLPQAQFIVGDMYLLGQGVQKNAEIAKEFYLKAANQGYTPAQYRLYRVFSEEQKYEAAIKWLTRAAENGFDMAQNDLANFYMNGKIFAVDNKKAFLLFEKAASQGLELAQANRGCMYMNGTGTSKDYSQAKQWYLKAAMQCDQGAFNNLGVMYLRGEGVSKNRIEAYKWLSLAKGSKLQVAEVSINDIKSDMTSSEIEKAEKLAKEWESTYCFRE